jgi:hypothetical protein
MLRRIRPHPRLTQGERYERRRHARDPAERSRWQLLWLLAGGLTATAIAQAPRSQQSNTDQQMSFRNR